MAAIMCPLASIDPMTTAAIALAGRCFEDAMSEEVYDASPAGLEHNIDLTIHGINAKVLGYDKNLPKYMEFILQRLVNFKPDPARFAIQKEALARTLRNFSHSQPYVLSQHSSSLIINEKMWSNQQLLAVAENLTIDDVTEALKNMRRAFHVEMLVHGNTTSQEVSSMSAELVIILRNGDDVTSRSLFANEAKLGRERDIEPVEQQVEKLRTLSKEDVIQFYDLKIVKGGAERRKLSVYVHSASDAVEKIDESRRSKRSKENGPAGDNGGKEEKEDKEEVVCMDSLKDRLAFYGLPAPFIQLPPIGTPAVTACTGEGETTPCKAKY